MSGGNPASRFATPIPGAQKRTPRSITISGVPESISRRDVTAFLEGIGVDPHEVAGLAFHPMAVEIEVYASERPSGRQSWRFTHDGENVATHRLTIPIIDKEPTP